MAKQRQHVRAGRRSCASYASLWRRKRASPTTLQAVVTEERQRRLAPPRSTTRPSVRDVHAHPGDYPLEMLLDRDELLDLTSDAGRRCGMSGW